MSVAAPELYDLELYWPSLGPTDVIVTGTFDQWSSSIRLVRGDTGFSGTVKVPWGQKVAYKFIVDGHWQYRDDRPQEDDGNGNVNNVLQTPEKPEDTVVYPMRLSIPLDGPLSEGHSAVDNMVTAVEFIPPAESAAARGSLPLPIPQITVEGLGVPSPVNESKLDTAAATEGNISPALVPPAEAKQAPPSRRVPILPLNEDNPLPPLPINGNGEASGIMTHAPIQFSKGKPLPSHSDEEVATPAGSAVPQPGHSSVATLDPTAKRPEVAPPEVAVLAVPSSIDPSTSSVPASSTVVHKKRRSFFARLKQIFDKTKDKQERKEKNRS